MMPRVSVCMTVYNGEATVRQALESVASQSYRDFEVLVVDDGSTDRTAAIAREFDSLGFDFRVISVPNSGTGAARKRLVETAKGEYIAFIDADDFWVHDKLEKQIDVLESTGAALVHADCWFLHPDGVEEPRDIVIGADANSFDHVIPGNLVINSSAVFRRDEMLAAGNFIAETFRCSDWYGWLVLAPGRKFVHMPEKLVRYSVLGTSLANGGMRFYEAQYELLTRHILPKRDELFAGLGPHLRAQYVRMLTRDAGIALSGVARGKWATGSHHDARVLAFHALKYAPASSKVWSRALSCLAP